MSEPSKDLWALLCELPRPHKIVEHPRKLADGSPVELVMWPMSQEEQLAASASAEAFTRRLLKDAQPKSDEARRGYDDIYQSEAAVQVLFRSCRRKDNFNLPFFPSLEAIRSMSTDEVSVMFMMYLTVQADVGPIVARMDKEEMDAFISRLIESGNKFPLDSISPALLKDLVISLVSRLSTYLTATSLPGSQPESGATETPLSES